MSTRVLPEEEGGYFPQWKLKTGGVPEERLPWGQTIISGLQHGVAMALAAALTAGAGDLTLKFGDFTMGGIGTATFGAIILYQILGWNQSKL